jgi:hypothetical protein
MKKNKYVKNNNSRGTGDHLAQNFFTQNLAYFILRLKINGHTFKTEAL